MNEELPLADFLRYEQMIKAVLERAAKNIEFIRFHIEENKSFFITGYKKHSFTFKCLHHEYRLSVLIEPDYLIKKKHANIVTHCINQGKDSGVIPKEPILLPELTADFDELGNIWQPRFFGENLYAIEFRDFLTMYVRAFVSLWETNNFPITYFQLD